MNIISVSKSVIFILLSFCVTSVQGEARSQFVGFSDLGVDGGAGIFAMQKLCNEKYDGSHVCNTTEVAQSTYDENKIYNLNAGGELSSDAWILVDIQSSSNNTQSSSNNTQSSSNNIQSIVISQFGLVNIDSDRPDRTLDCHGWSTRESEGKNEGATVTREGWFKNTTQCNFTLPVACCE